MIIKLQGQPDYEQNTVSRDPVKLLIMLRDMAHNYDSTKDETMSIIESDMKLMMGFQGKTATVDELLCLFRSRVKTIIAHGGNLGHHLGQVLRVLKREKEKEGLDETAYLNLGTAKIIAFDMKGMKQANNEYLACLFMRQADAGRYRNL